MADEEKGQGAQVHVDDHKSYKWVIAVGIAVVLGAAAVVAIRMRQGQNSVTPGGKLPVSPDESMVEQTPPPLTAPTNQTTEPSGAPTHDSTPTPKVATPKKPTSIAGAGDAIKIDLPGQQHTSLVETAVGKLQTMDPKALLAFVPMAGMVFPMLKNVLLTLPLYGTIMMGAVVAIYLLYDFFVPSSRKTGLVDSFKNMTLFPRLMLIGLVGVFGWAAFMFASPLVAPLVANILNMVVAA